MKLLSWNIQWGRGMDGIVDLLRILKTIQQLDDFDVICLQEVAVNFASLPGSQGEDQFAELSAGLPDYTAIYGPATDFPDKNGENKKRRLFGNAIFSRLPVGQIWRHPLPWVPEPATPSMQRILVEAVVSTDTAPIRVMTTHLEYYSQHQRALQVEAIRRLHDEACLMSNRPSLTDKQDGPFEVFQRPSQAILCGDMNFTATAQEYSHILAPFDNKTPCFYDARALKYPGEPHAATVGIQPVSFVDQPKCFDHIFITDGLINSLKAHQVDAVTQASDHQPVWIELQ